MRIHLAGQGSFIARAVLEVARAQNITVQAWPHNAEIQPSAGDCVINFALAPAYRRDPYQRELDRDLAVARMARQANAHFIMLSTRRVYPQPWDARESDLAEGDDTAYGRNKAISEKAVMALYDGAAAVFRMSNIFGYEYNAASPRTSFLGLLLRSLKQKDRIFFDMSALSRRDFLPVEVCAEALVARAIDHSHGIFNLGAGFAVPCGSLASWISEGYGSGELVCDPDIVRDEFCLNMDKWRSQFSLPVDEKNLREYCLELGRRLQCEKS